MYPEPKFDDKVKVGGNGTTARQRLDKKRDDQVRKYIADLVTVKRAQLSLPLESIECPK